MKIRSGIEKMKKLPDSAVINDMGIIRSISVRKSPLFSNSRAGENLRKKGGNSMKTGLTKKQKITELYFNAKDPLAEV